MSKCIQRFITRFVERELSGGVGPFSFNSSGVIFRTRWCRNPELTRRDLTGACMFGEINIGLLKSRSMTLFLLGMNLSSLMDLVVGNVPSIFDIEQVPPKAIVLSKGTGLGVGIAADIYGGVAA